MGFIKKNWPLLLLVIIGFSLYAFNLHNKLFWDDDDWIINNPAVHSLSWSNVKFWFTHNTLAGIGLKSNYYRPRLFFTFGIKYGIGGIKPLGYHLLSNLIHVGNAILIFLILNSVLCRLRRQQDQQGSSLLNKDDPCWISPVAFLVALFFLIHPLQTEAVTYISGRGDLLTAFFMLLALLFFFKSVPTTSSRFYSSQSDDYKIEDPRSLSGSGQVVARKWQWRLLSLGSLVLALFSRETAIIFPLLLMVFYVAFLSGERFLRSLKTAFIKALPYLAVVFTYGILRLTVLNFKNVLNFYDQPNIYSSHLYVRIFTFLKVLLVYFKLLFIPTGLHMERGMDPQLSFFKWPVLLGASIILLIVVVVYLFYRKEHLDNGLKTLNPKHEILNKSEYQNSKSQNVSDLDIRISDFRIWLFGFGWFFIALAPVSGITPINALIYEHWLYLPMVGFFFVVSYYLAQLIAFLKNNHKSVPLGILIAALAGYFVFFGAQAIKRNVLWGKPIPFYEDILKYEPDSVRINNNIGNMYYNEGNVAKAEESYRKAVAEEDIFPQPHFNLGSILQSKGDIFGAVQEYKKAIEIDPNFYYAYQNLVALYAKNGELTLAAENIEKLKQLRPNDARILYNAALIYAAMGEWKLALENAQQGLNSAGSDQEVGGALEELLARLKK